jgi:GNAT superfamily N-acetyltransferase
MDTRPIDPSSAHELTAVLELFRLVYGREISEVFYRWRFLQNPFGPPMVSLLWDGPTLAGHYSVSPRRSRIGDATVMTAQSMTTMTHPHYRSQGVFTTLAKDLYARMADMGVVMVWGFPNTQSHYGFVQRLGWRDIGVVITMSRETGMIPDDATQLTPLPAPDDRVSELFERSLDGRIFPAFRDAPYLKWRYLDNPATRYLILTMGKRPDALAVTKSYLDTSKGRCLEVMEVLYGRDPQLALPLFSALLSYARATGHGRVRTWLHLSDPAFPELEKLSFVPSEPIAYFAGRTLGAFSLPADRMKLECWAVSMGDSDNY